MKIRLSSGGVFVSGIVAILLQSWLWLLAIAVGSCAADAGMDIGLKIVAQGFTSPIAVVPVPDGSGRLLIVDQIGTVHVLNKEGKLIERPFLDLRDRLVALNQEFDERGLLGLALHPRFRDNGRFFVFYSAPLRADAPKDWDHTGRLSEFKVSSSDPNRADPASERTLLQVDHPYFNHNSGRVIFGPDGMLYLAIGDGGNAHDAGRGHGPRGNGQDLTTLLGKILRLDVDSGTPYGIPRDNPFADGNGRPEIFAYGLRNAWGISFDRGGDHELFAADVGQDRFEEINIIRNGGNYGWNIREGFDCFDPKNPLTPPADCPKQGSRGDPLLDPILAYKNFKGFMRDPEARGISVTGGYIYRGKALPQLQGRYLFADWSRQWIKPDGVLFVARRPESTGSKSWTLEPLDLATHPKGQVGAYIVALGEDAEGELYVMTNDSNALVGKTGKVYKLVAR